MTRQSGVDDSGWQTRAWGGAGRAESSPSAFLPRSTHAQELLVQVRVDERTHDIPPGPAMTLLSARCGAGVYHGCLVYPG